MCRLFGQVTTEETDAKSFLLAKKYSLLGQSDCNKKYLQKDGWGIGYWLSQPSQYTKDYLENSKESRGRGSWNLIKSPRPIYREKKRFRGVAQKNRSTIILAHIRHASNPKKLPEPDLIKFENTQPFVHKNLIFAHNGTLNIMDEMTGTLGPYKKNLRGTNDSEVLFWLFVKMWKKHRSIQNPEALWQKVFRGMIRQIVHRWKKIPKSKRKFSAPYRGLNCLASDGNSFAALCFYDKAEGFSLCGQRRPYFEMCYNISEKRIAVASEPMDESREWHPIPVKHLLVVKADCSTTLTRIQS